MDEAIAIGELAVNGGVIGLVVGATLAMMAMVRSTTKTITTQALRSAEAASNELTDYRIESVRDRTALRAALAELEGRLTAQASTLLDQAEQLAQCRIESAQAIERESILQHRVDALEARLAAMG